MAALLVRDRGRVVCLGNTEINLDWRLWFGKEIEFLFSRSTGAGIYDPDYFTQRKRLSRLAMSAGRRSETCTAFLDLLAQEQDRSIKPDHPPLRHSTTPWTCSIGSPMASWAAPSASCSNIPTPTTARSKASREPSAFPARHPLRKVRLGMIGAGNYAKSMLLPHFHALKDLSLVTICTSRGMNAEAIAERYQFRNATTDAARDLQGSGDQHRGGRHSARQPWPIRKRGA